MKSLFAVAVALSLCGCAPSAVPPPAPSVPPSVPPSAGESSPAGPSSQAPSDFTVTFGFAVPNGVVRVSHPVPVPPLRTLVGVYVGNHPSESPAYQRMSFYFQGGYPSYQVSYVPSVTRDGSGAPVSLPGNAFLQVVFTDAQAHTSSGASSVTASPPASIGYQNLKGYAQAGDFEGHVTYGLGLQTRPNADQVLLLRLGELTRPDGLYVVFVDIQTA